MCNKIGGSVANYFIDFSAILAEKFARWEKNLQSFLCGIFIGFCIACL
jgi:hypothetical protein